MHAAATPVETGTRRLPSAGRIALVVALAHGLNDAYSAFVPPLLPRIMDRLDLSVAMAATLAMTFSLSSSVLQPFVGYLADRYGRRAFLVAGPLITALFVSLIGLAPTFSVLLAMLAVGGLGSAAFHPPGASYAARISEGKGSATRMSLFSFGGAVGYALGPLVAVAIVERRGMGGMWVAMLPVLLLTPLLYGALPSGRSERTLAQRPPRPVELARHLVGPLGVVFGISAVLAFGQRVFLTMEPIIVARAGGSETVGAVALTAFLAAQAVGSLAGGVLAERVPRARLLFALCLLEIPALAGAVGLAPGSASALVAAAAAGFLGTACVPAIVVTAQEMLPRGTAATSGIVMGLAWASGAVGVLGTGVLADAIGAHAAALASVPVLVVAVVLSAHPALARVHAGAA